MRDREEVGPLSSPRAALAAKRAVPSSIERGRYTRRARSREIADCFCATSRRGLELEHVCVCVRRGGKVRLDMYGLFEGE